MEGATAVRLRVTALLVPRSDQGRRRRGHGFPAPVAFSARHLSHSHRRHPVVLKSNLARSPARQRHVFFAMTDSRNAGSWATHRPSTILFDGNHAFPADDGLPDGQETAHDRALSVLRVAFVDLDRLHADPSMGVINDSVTIKGQGRTGSGTVTTTALAHVLIGLRQTVLSLDAAVTQYGAADESPSADSHGILNCPSSPKACSIHDPPAGRRCTPSVQLLCSPGLRKQCHVRAGRSHGARTEHVANGATISNGKARVTTDTTSLESQTAAARALTEAFLLTGDVSFEARARLVMQHLYAAFYSAPARACSRGQEGGRDEVFMTPERFGWLQSALRGIRLQNALSARRSRRWAVQRSRTRSHESTPCS